MEALSDWPEYFEERGSGGGYDNSSQSYLEPWDKTISSLRKKK